MSEEKLNDVAYIIETVFGDLGYSGVVCNSCKSAIEYCVIMYNNTTDSVSKKLNSRANQLRNSLKRNLK